MRNTFLTTLCIITFVVSGISIIGAIITYNTSHLITALNNKNKIKVDSLFNKNLSTDTSLNNSNKNTFSIIKKITDQTYEMNNEKNTKSSSLAKLFSGILCVLGAFLMWGLRKTGFYIYVIGTLVGIICPIFIYGTSNLISLTGIIFTGIFGIIFCVMYGMNYKQLIK